MDTAKNLFTHKSKHIIPEREIDYFLEIGRKHCLGKGPNTHHVGRLLIYKRVDGVEKVILKYPREYCFEEKSPKTIISRKQQIFFLQVGKKNCWGKGPNFYYRGCDMTFTRKNWVEKITINNLEEYEFEN
ncbi:hypothetical protein KKH36_04220 [Patescibacteria group bacterium]|nr:hypothetical protein [Patescibacteria group bacterium]